MNKCSLICLLVLLTTIQGYSKSLPEGYKQNFRSANVTICGDTIGVSTGNIERKWLHTKHGLITVSVKDILHDKEWSKPNDNIKCDWDLPGAIDGNSDAELVSFTVTKSNDEGFVNEHLEVTTHFRYDSSKLEIEHVVWLFPGATGIRTQLRVKAMDGFKTDGLPERETIREYFGHTLSVPSARAEYLPLDFTVKNERLYWGYYNDPGSRHDQSRDMLKEERVLGFPIFQDEDINWASGVTISQGDNGICVVKESHKCVNQQGHNTGSFYAGPRGLLVTGWGIEPKEIVTDRFRECWANWTVVYRGGNDEMQLSLKKFDRIRYPVFTERDMMIINDTWGPANPGGAQFTQEDYLLKEIPILADLGIDVLRIDDGWQINPWGGDKESFLPNYKDGWKNISDACNKSGIKLGLWVAIQRAKQSELLDNLDKANVVTWKVDFDLLNDKTAFENRFKGIRELMKNSWMKTQFSFCPEYNHPRYGWYYAKEYGSIYFQNLQEALPEHLAMVPYHVLRQNWLMTKYYNGNKLQVLLQNPKRVDKNLSDAYMHSHSYCFAMGVPFVPVFFQSAQYLDDDGRGELKQFISLYKEHREKIFNSYSFPIGDAPTNGSWAGFQFIDENMSSGYLLLFRELYNSEQKKSIKLKFLAGKSIEIIDIENDSISQQEIDSEGYTSFEIPSAASYKFLSYRISN